MSRAVITGQHGTCAALKARTEQARPEDAAAEATLPGQDRRPGWQGEPDDLRHAHRVGRMAIQERHRRGGLHGGIVQTVQSPVQLAARRPGKVAPGAGDEQ